MPKILSSEQIEKILSINGFEFVSQRGSHRKYRNKSGETAIVPTGRKEIPRGTISSIIRQSGIDRKLFD